jgi:hypothetical protein
MHSVFYTQAGKHMWAADFILLFILKNIYPPIVDKVKYAWDMFTKKSYIWNRSIPYCISTKNEVASNSL